MILLLALAQAAEWAPTAWPAPAPGVSTAEVVDAPPKGLLERLYRQYRMRSEQDGAQCAFYPTCSAYGILAVREHGVPLGGLLTVDRLLREHPGMVSHYPVVTPHQTPRWNDPVPAGRRAR
ncbi:MAG: membrane protein insertion efficiency factor YidD [Myxococcota bacterium]|nr:membrane protein insertion efficiency factor YidD [Myxococcota bacterium]